ncbi:PTS system beta-glucoside-specific IIA component (Glc family) /PTS system beta-glucoside-specific IIB component (Glc family) /PTS system beta-glucoside-specific IIC component (Glc family) [Streptomyces sp. TLI_55]|uniref:beta-glucoside-specific PTS transporter subunit IIABC n=1 Tax=Streptomyces sp. TLI_55 TaxID=1938861 RepID=UPI000BDBCCA0|nr:beta-glucoside-specific PTS transporter subunit IIABC [Streptomyces sp. TLI_55]SNX66647.1 PTS system beta-glucoside-specific IIA component (Glc family) /PTS system beta-glucoside-specific IIB component (Glc family) /PTS system beta-glucoside-specific IIC component (Glc family) [Streptomyces sp. TLI_55]
MDVNGSAKAVLDALGGAQNVAALQHCSTRLRFTLADDAKVDAQHLRAIPGVVGVVTGPPQTQVVVGSKVIDFHNALSRLLGDRDGDGGAVPAAKTPWTWKRLGGTVMDFVVSVFTPVVPAIAGAGVLKSLLLLLTTIHWVSDTDPTYLLFAAIPTAVFTFLPLFVAYTTARKLNVNRPVALGTVGVLLHPGFTELITREGGISMFGIPVTNVPYNAQVFPAILAVLFLAIVERFFNKYTPGPIRVFFVPMMCFLIVVPVTMLALGPLGYGMGTQLTSAMLWMHSTLGWVAVALLAALLPFVISVGMHKAFIPPTINTMTATGSESLYNPASLAHNMSEAGATLAIALRTKRQELRATSLSAGVSALFGITEPALYGVTLQNKRTLVAVVAGAFSGGAYVGITHVSSYAVVGPGLASMSMFVNADDPSNIVNAVVGLLVAFGVAFAISALTWKDSTSAAVAEKTRQAGPESVSAGASGAGELLITPVSGVVVPLSEVGDQVFSSGVLGAGVAIEPTSGRFVAPVDGTVTSLLPSKHAIGITTPSGAEILVHIGIDTVKLAGEHFTAHVAQGDTVTAGQLVVDVDIEAVKAAGYVLTTPVVVLNSADHPLSDIATGPVGTDGPLATLRKKELSDAAA